MNFLKNYTTSELKQADLAKPKAEQTNEAEKIEVSNDAFALCDYLENLIKKLEQTRLSFYK